MNLTPPVLPIKSAENLCLPTSCDATTKLRYTVLPAIDPTFRGRLPGSIEHEAAPRNTPLRWVPATTAAPTSVTTNQTRTIRSTT